MNIHRELQAYRLLVIRSHEAAMRMREAQCDDQENECQEPSIDSLAETSIYLAIDQLCRKKANEIADAFEYKAKP